MERFCITVSSTNVQFKISRMREKNNRFIEGRRML